MESFSGLHKGISISRQTLPSTRARDLASRTVSPPATWLGALTERTGCPAMGPWEPGPSEGSRKAGTRPGGWAGVNEMMEEGRWGKTIKSSRQRKTASWSPQSKRESRMFQELRLEKEIEGKGRLRWSQRSPEHKGRIALAWAVGLDGGWPWMPSSEISTGIPFLYLYGIWIILPSFLLVHIINLSLSVSLWSYFLSD